MPLYRWYGLSTEGNSLYGTSFAPSLKTLETILLNKKIALLTASTIKQNNLLTNKEIYTFFDNLNVLIKSGISITHALQTLETMYTGNLAYRCTHMYELLKQGNAFSTSLITTEMPIPLFYISLIQTGEKTGQLSTTLDAITAHYLQIITIQKNIRSAIITPSITLAFALVIITGILLCVVPQFEQLFLNFDKPIPTLTQKLITVSAWMRSLQGVLSFSICIALSYILYKKIKASMRHTVYIYGLHTIYCSYALTQCLLTIQLCLKVGEPLTKALTTAHNNTHDTMLQKELSSIINYLHHGQSLSTAIKKQSHNYFSPDIIALLELGEKTGSLQLFVEKAQSYTAKKLTTQLSFIEHYIQPTIIIFVGILVGALLLILYIPIFTLASTL